MSYSGCASAVAPSPPRRLSSRARVLAAAALLLALAYVLLFHRAPSLLETALAIFLASLTSSIAGFAFSAICGAMLFHLNQSQVAVVQTMIVCSVFNQSYMVWSLRRDVRWARVVPFLAGGLVGLPLGIALLLHVDRKEYLLGAGSIIALYGVYMLLRPPVFIRKGSRMLDAAIGVLGGVTGGGGGFPGLFVTIWCGVKGWDKIRQRAVYQPFILVMQVVTLATICIMHPGGARVTGIALTFVPAALVGSAFGMTLFRRINDRQFRAVVNLLLIVSGISLAL